MSGKKRSAAESSAGPLSSSMGALAYAYKRAHLEEAENTSVAASAERAWFNLEESEQRQFLNDTVRYCLLKQG